MRGVIGRAFPVESISNLGLTALSRSRGSGWRFAESRVGEGLPVRRTVPAESIRFIIVSGAIRAAAVELSVAICRGRRGSAPQADATSAHTASTVA